MVGAVRVVSLVPSVTETLVTWGVVPVGVTRFCDRPGVPTVGGTKDPDLSAVMATLPDLVIMDTEENRREDYDALCAAGLTVHVTEVRSLLDVGPALEALAEALGVAGPPPLEAPTPTATRRAFVPIWRRPWRALGEPTYGASVLGALGVAVVPAGRGPYPATSLAEAQAWNPEVVLAPSEPYPFSARQRPELESVAPVVFVDGKDLFWWGSRTAGALERLATVVGFVGAKEA